MLEKKPTIRNSGDQKLIERVRSHLGENCLDLTPEEAVHYHDGGQYGGPPDPRSLRAHRSYGQRTAEGGSGPKK